MAKVSISDISMILTAPNSDESTKVTCTMQLKNMVYSNIEDRLLNGDSLE